MVIFNFFICFTLKNKWIWCQWCPNNGSGAGATAKWPITRRLIFQFFYFFILSFTQTLLEWFHEQAGVKLQNVAGMVGTRNDFTPNSFEKSDLKYVSLASCSLLPPSPGGYDWNYNIWYFLVFYWFCSRRWGLFSSRIQLSYIFCFLPDKPRL